MTQKKVLAIKLREIGDIVLWTSALRALREKLPGAQLDVLVPVVGEPILRHSPWIDRIWTVPSNRPLPVLRQLWKLRSAQYDLAIGFHVNTSLSRMARVLGAEDLILHHHSWRYNPRAATLKVPRPGNLEDAIQRDFQLIEAIDGLPAPSPSPPSVYLSAEESQWAADRLNSTRSWMALLPGARAQTRRYPLDLWLRTLDELSRRFPGLSSIVLVDLALSKEWNLRARLESRGIPLFDDLTLRQLMALLSRCQIAVGNDSGPIHIAAALGLKTVTLFGAGCLGDFHPYDAEKHIALWKEVPCRAGGPRDRPDFQFCGLLTCSHLSCLRGLSPETIWASIGKLGET